VFNRNDMAFDGQVDFDFDTSVSTSQQGKQGKRKYTKKAKQQQQQPEEKIIDDTCHKLDGLTIAEDVQHDNGNDDAPLQDVHCKMSISNGFDSSNLESGHPPATIPSTQTRPIPLVYNKYSQVWKLKKNLEDAKVKSWPESTNICCWWCCHTFDTVPVPLPTGYNDRFNTFSIKGNFCSWGCAKAYCINQENSLGVQSELLFMMRKRVEGKALPIKCAPSPQQLKMFGGTMSIEEFRRSTCTECVRPMLTVNMITKSFGLQMIDHVNDQYGASTPMMDFGKSKALKSDLDLSNLGVTKNEPLKLKRSKPVTNNKGKTVLEKVLGIGAFVV
jgi:MYM-type Zinc finger with FCS sequence motif